MKRIAAVCLAVGLTLGISGIVHAWSLGADVKTTVNNNKNSNNNNSKNTSTGDNKSSFNTTTNSQRYDNDTTKNSNNKTDSRSYKYDNDVNVDTHAITDSYNTDSRSYSDQSSAITDSYKGNSFEYDASTGKRIASHDITGGVRNSIMGDFNQMVGADFSAGFGGTATTFDASTVNTQTFGDVSVSTPATE